MYRGVHRQMYEQISFLIIWNNRGNSYLGHFSNSLGTKNKKNIEQVKLIEQVINQILFEVYFLFNSIVKFNKKYQISVMLLYWHVFLENWTHAIPRKHGKEEVLICSQVFHRKLLHKT